MDSIWGLQPERGEDKGGKEGPQKGVLSPLVGGGMGSKSRRETGKKFRGLGIIMPTVGTPGGGGGGGKKGECVYKIYEQFSKTGVGQEKEEQKRVPEGRKSIIALKHRSSQHTQGEREEEDEGGGEGEITSAKDI